MGLKDGYKLGVSIAETVYHVSSKYDSARDPNLKVELLGEGITRQEIVKLAIHPSLDLTEIGIMVGGFSFFVKHGTIWNSKDMYPRIVIKD